MQEKIATIHGFVQLGCNLEYVPITGTRSGLNICYQFHDHGRLPPSNTFKIIHGHNLFSLRQSGSGLMTSARGFQYHSSETLTVVKRDI